jgi:hypothetical protein
LFGGGSLRNQNAADVEDLRRRGFIDDEQKLSMLGLLVLTLAMRAGMARDNVPILFQMPVCSPVLTPLWPNLIPQWPVLENRE